MGYFSDDKINEYIKKINKTKQVDSFDIISYSNWLSDYLNENDEIDLTNYMYNNEDYNKVNLKNITRLDRFFKEIYQYAKKNHIWLKYEAYSCYFYLNINNNFYKLVFDYGQGSNHYLKKVDKNKDNNTVKPGVLNINDKLNNLSNLINDMYEDGIPLESIQNAVDNVINNIKTKKEKDYVRKHVIDN